MENEQKINRRELFKKAGADARLFAEGAAAIYIASLRVGSENKASDETKNLPILEKDPISVGLMMAGLVTAAVAMTRRLPDMPVGR